MMFAQSRSLKKSLVSHQTVNWTRKYLPYIYEVFFEKEENWHFITRGLFDHIHVFIVPDNEFKPRYVVPYQMIVHKLQIDFIQFS